jgi:hypothetical protein
MGDVSINQHQTRSTSSAGMAAGRCGVVILGIYFLLDASAGRINWRHQVETSTGCSNLSHEVHASNECNVWTHRLDASSGCIDWTCHGLRNGRDPLMRRMFGACYEEVS